jgi:hypothetical protein
MTAGKSEIGHPGPLQNISRRALLLSSSACLVCQAASARMPVRTFTLFDKTVRALLARVHLASAASIGRAVVAAHPELCARDRVLTGLLMRLGLNYDDVGRLPAGQILDLVAQAIESDFAEGSVIDVFGWRLAATEARLCALATVYAE